MPSEHSDVLAERGAQAGPPVLTGQEAEMNRAERVLEGSWTSKDMELYRWCVRNVANTLFISGLGAHKDVCYYLGEQIWPPT